MDIQDFIEKAKNLGLSDEEIQLFIENQKVAQKYSINDDCYSLNIQIDKSLDEESQVENLNKHSDTNS